MKALIYTFAISAVLLASGCATKPVEPTIVTVEVPVPVPCNIKAPEVPVWPLQTSPITEKNVYKNSKLAIAEIELRKGYEGKLEAAIKECNNK